MPTKQPSDFAARFPFGRRFDVLIGATIIVAVGLNVSVLSLGGRVVGEESTATTTSGPSDDDRELAAPTLDSPPTVPTVETFEYQVESWATVVIEDDAAALELVAVDAESGWAFEIEESTGTALELTFFKPGEDDVTWRLVRRDGQLTARTER